MPWYPAVQAWLRLQVRTNPCATAFHKDETTTHLVHDMQQSMCYSYVQSWKSVVIGCLNGQHWDQYSRRRHGAIANTGTSTVGDTEQ